MNSRLAKSQRLRRVVRELDRLAEWRCADVARRLATVERQRSDLAAFLQREDLVSDLFAASALRRDQGLRITEESLRAEARAATIARISEGGRLRQVATLVDALNDVERRQSERRTLDAAIDASIGRDTKGSGKLDGPF